MFSKRVKLWSGSFLVALVIFLGADLLMRRSSLSNDDRHDRMLAMYKEYRRNFLSVPEITVDELLATPDRFRLVDVRTADEQDVSRIPGSLSLEEFEQSSAADDDRTIVLYCTIGYRSGLEAQRMLLAGYRVGNLRGGILGWCHARQALSVAGRATMQVHVYGSRWNLAPAEYTAIW